jgi:hypothetical protein
MQKGLQLNAQRQQIPRQNRRGDASVRSSPLMFQAMSGRSTEASAPLNE